MAKREVERFTAFPDSEYYSVYSVQRYETKVNTLQVAIYDKGA